LPLKFELDAAAQLAGNVFLARRRRPDLEANGRGHVIKRL
jgi:hypothetical protein